MGKGDRRSKKGKIWRGTTGKSKPVVKKKNRFVAKKEVKAETK